MWVSKKKHVREVQKKIHMFIWLAILCCHLVCVGAKRDLKMEKIRSFSDAWKGYLKTWDRWNSQSFQGHYLIWGAYSAPYEPLVAMTNLPTHVGLWLTTIKLNPSWKNGGQQKFLDKALMVFFFWENVMVKAVNDLHKKASWYIIVWRRFQLLFLKTTFCMAYPPFYIFPIPLRPLFRGRNKRNLYCWLKLNKH